MIDTEDLAKVQNYKWYLNNSGYPTTHVNNGKGKRDGLRLHVLILGKIRGKYVDHKNHNILDCRKENLRHCSPHESSLNRGKSKCNTSGATGVYHNPKERKKKWFARIHLNGNAIYLGSFDFFEDAVKARKLAEIKYFGEFRYKENK